MTPAMIMAIGRNKLDNFDFSWCSMIMNQFNHKIKE